MFSWAVWVSLSRDNFSRAADMRDTPGREDEGPYFGWLNTALSPYSPSIINLKTHVHTRPVGQRPFIELEPTDHPLAVEQRNGITLDRVREIAEAVLTPPAMTPDPHRSRDGLMKQLSEMSEREYFANVGRRPGMFVGKTSFHMLAAFLTGYDQNALRHGAPGLAGWQEWLVARRGHSCEHGWPGQVLHIALPDGWDNLWDLSTEDEKHAIEVLFQLLDEFMAARDSGHDLQVSD